MHTIRLDISNDIYDKVIAFIEKLPKNKIKLQIETKEDKTTPDNNAGSLVDFFRSSPLVGEVSLEREEEVYKARVEF